MAKCKWCGEQYYRGDLNVRGYCEECYNALRSEIIELKTRRDELTKRSSDGLPDEEKEKIILENEKIYQRLRTLKKKRVSFMKSDIEAPRNEIYARLGRTPPSVQKPTRSVVDAVLVVLIIAGILMLVIGIPVSLIHSASEPVNMMDVETISHAELDDIAVISVSSKEEPKTRSYSRELCSGHYTVGVDIPCGTYDLTATKGGGNVFGAGINEIMGVSTMNNDLGYDFYTQKLEDVYLADGDVLSVSGVRIGISSHDASAEPLAERGQEITETIDLEPDFSYVAGTDFEPGTYCIEALSGGGNVWTENVDEYGMNEVMGVNDEGFVLIPDFYETQFNNVYLPDRAILYVGEVSLRLTPSK